MPRPPNRKSGPLLEIAPEQDRREAQTEPEGQAKPAHPRDRPLVNPTVLVWSVDRAGPGRHPRHEGRGQDTPHEADREDEQEHVGHHRLASPQGPAFSVRPGGNAAKRLRRGRSLAEESTESAVRSDTGPSQIREVRGPGGRPSPRWRRSRSEGERSPASPTVIVRGRVASRGYPARTSSNVASTRQSCYAAGCGARSGRDSLSMEPSLIAVKPEFGPFPKVNGCCLQASQAKKC